MTQIDPYPHPAFPVAQLPEKVRDGLKTKGGHYPQQYLDDLRPLNSSPKTRLEKFAKSAVDLIFATALLAAQAEFLWIGNSYLLNPFASKRHKKQTIWLRQILLLEGLAPCHGLASGLLHHFETIVYNPKSGAPHGMVYALLAEFNVHRTHFLTFCSLAKPGILTRLLILVTQIAACFVQALICVFYMPLCFQLSRFTDEAASRVYWDLGKDIDAGLVPDIASAKVPEGTKLFYALPANSSMRQVCQCIKADDVFVAKWEDTATWHHHDVLSKMYAN